LMEESDWATDEKIDQHYNYSVMRIIF